MGKHIYVVLIIALLSISQLCEGRKTYSSRSRGSSSGSSSRRTSHTSNSGHVTKPTFQQSSNSHADIAKLSYPGYNSQPNRPATSNTGSHAASAPELPKQTNQQSNPPIGWNVPNSKPEAPAVAVNKPPVQAGPPPAYSPQNVPGARTNVHEAPPAYSPHQPAVHQQPAYQAPPSYQQATNPQHGMYPQQHGAYPQQHGAYPQQQGAYPQQPVMYPQQHGGYPQQPGMPAGFPSGYQQQGQPVFYQNAAVQPGYYPAGSFPVQQKSSGPGFGTGILAGAVGGAILGHVLTPSQQAERDRVIVINNNPGETPAPGATAAPGAPAPAPAAAAPAPVAPAPGAAAPVAPVPVAPIVPGAVPPVPGAEVSTPTPLAPFPVVEGSNVTTPTPLAPFPQNNMAAPPQPAAADNTTAPGAGMMCVPVMVNVTDPNNPANITTVQQIACYNVQGPPPADTPPQQTPLAPMPPQQTPLAPMPPPSPLPVQKESTATLAENSPINSNRNSANGLMSMSSILGVLLSTTTALIATYCLH